MFRSTKTLLMAGALLLPIAASAQPQAREAEPREKPAARQEFDRMKRAPVGEKVIPVDRYFTALERMKTMPHFSTARKTALPTREALRHRGVSYAVEASSLGAWASLGPGNVGGRTRAIVIDPRQPDVMYAAGVAGGVWKTLDGGSRWSPLDDLMANLAVSTLAMDPADPAVLYAGTGEGFAPGSEGEGNMVRGAGIFKTTDGGATWTRLAATGGPDFHYVNKLVVSPLDSRRVYAATQTGVWRSRDGGATWQRILELERQPTGCLDLALRSDQPARDVLFASCGGSEGGAVYRNRKADRQANWERVLRERGMGRISLAIAPSDQDVIYALAASTVPGPGKVYAGGLHAVFRSGRGGDFGSWTAQVRNSSPRKVDTVLLSNPSSAFSGECFGAPRPDWSNQGWYDNVIAVDPVDPDRVWAGGIDLFRSDNGGRTWGPASYWWLIQQPPPVRDHPAYVHADQHALVFHPAYDGVTNKTLFVGNDGGIFKTEDARARIAVGTRAACGPQKAHLRWTNLNNGYGVTQFYHGAASPDGTFYLGGTQDNGNIASADALGPDGWVTLAGGDGGYVAVDRDDPRILYVEYVSFALSKSLDGGRTFKDALDGIADDPGFLFIAPFTMDPSDSRRLWAGGVYLWRTTDGAENWTRVSSFLNTQVSAIAISPVDPNRVLVGGGTLFSDLQGGTIHRTAQALTADGSTEWPAARPRDGHVSSLAFDPLDSNVAYATYSNFGGTHVWKTMDGGATWSPLDGTGAGALPDIPVHCIAVDPLDAQRLYLGTDLGVFVSTDGGESWSVENSGFANVRTEWLSVHEAPDGTTSLFAFTHGRGAWKVEIAR